jgi:assimilatory nitrate reductase catalytic subunit
MAIACLCRGVSERKIRRAVDNGALSVAQVGDICTAGTCCSGCHETIESIIDECVVSAPQRRLRIA